MHKYGGVVIHESQDEYGTMEVVEDGTIRSLHFGSRATQSSMRLDAPEALVLSYTRAMMSALLLTAPPSRVLLIGLGGGSLVKFLLHHFSRCHVDAVEQRENVIKVARGYFRLPEDDRLHIHIGDGGDFVRDTADPAAPGYDLLLVDAFTGRGGARSVCGLSFFQACRDCLRPGGVLAVNLWTRDFVASEQSVEDLRESFEGRVLRLPIPGKDNVVALAATTPLTNRLRRLLGERARALESELGIEFPVFLRAMRKYNRGLF